MRDTVVAPTEVIGSPFSSRGDCQVLTPNSAANAITGNNADTMRSTTEPFIRRDKDAPRAPANGMTDRYGMVTNGNLFFSKGPGPSMKHHPRNNRQDAAPGNQTFLACNSRGVSRTSRAPSGLHNALPLTCGTREPTIAPSATGTRERAPMPSGAAAG